jgi:hypothetical protein
VLTASHSGVIGSIHDFKQPRQFVRVVSKVHDFAIPRRDSPEFLQQSFRPKKIEGAGNTGCTTHPQPRVRNKTNTRVSHHRSTETARHSPRNGFNGFLRALMTKLAGRLLQFPAKKLWRRSRPEPQSHEGADPAEQHSRIGEHVATPEFGNKPTDRRANKNSYPDR